MGGGGWRWKRTVFILGGLVGLTCIQSPSRVAAPALGTEHFKSDGGGIENLFLLVVVLFCKLHLGCRNIYLLQLEFCFWHLPHAGIILSLFACPSSPLSLASITCRMARPFIRALSNGLLIFFKKALFQAKVI